MELFIKGFKSISKGQYISIGRKITFLVGPNSAGKSVVMLALEKLKGVNPAFDLDESQIHKNPNRDDEISSIQTLGLTWINKNEKLSCYSSYCSENISEEVIESEIDFSIQKEDSTMNLNEYNLDSQKFFMEYFLDGKKILTVGGLEKYGDQKTSTGLSNIARAMSFFDGSLNYIIDLKNLDDSIKVKLLPCSIWSGQIFIQIANNTIDGLKQEIQDLQPGSEKFNKISRSIDNIERAINIRKIRLDNYILKWNPQWIKNTISSVFSGKERQRHLNAFEKNNSIILKYINGINLKFESSYPGNYFNSSLVDAERTLPKSSDIETVRGFEDGNIYHDLIESLTLKDWKKHVNARDNSWQKNNDKSLLSEQVNKALSENLFVDNAYCVTVDSKILVSINEWNQHSINSDIPEFLCQMYLKDTHGRKLKFEDVGSGIGYVLPILIESFKPSNKKQIVFLQQPELHLHPALQASLADVLIEASSNKKIVAETHSEHMILRALKRIRQTSNKTLIDPELRLKPEDIAVNYFEPLSDGSTKVHILRVTEDGDFLDRWPNGFFSERDQELFDE